jgi:hypothetical protein
MDPTVIERCADDHASMTTCLGMVDVYRIDKPVPMIGGRGAPPATDDALRRLVRRLEDCGRYNTVIDGTPRGLMRELSANGVRYPRTFEEYVSRNIEKESISLSNQWDGVIVPFLDSLLGFALECRATIQSTVSLVVGGKAAVVVYTPYTPWTCARLKRPMQPDGDARRDVMYTISQCCAYRSIGLPTRGGDCGRWATDLTPENLAHASAHVGGFRACVLPNNALKCIMVVCPSERVAWFFKMNGGSTIANHRPVALWSMRDGDGGERRLPTSSSVFECTFNPVTDLATIYDCAVSSGTDVRAKTLTERIEIARGIVTLHGWALGENRRPPIVSTYRAHNDDDAMRAQVVMFVRDLAPLGTFPGGDAYVWRSPTLSAGQRVMMLRRTAPPSVPECLAAESRQFDYMLRRVGTVSTGAASSSSGPPPHDNMGSFVFEREPRTDSWRIVRPARRSERMSTYDECTCVEGERHNPSQVPREDMIRMLGRIASVTAADPASGDVRRPERATTPRHQPPMTVPDGDGFVVVMCASSRGVRPIKR